MAGRYDDRVVPVGHELGDAADPCHDGGQAERERLHERDRQPLVEGRQAEDVERGHHGHRGGTEPEEVEARPELESRVLLSELGFERPAADRDEAGVGNAVDDRARCFEQVGIALGGAQVRDRTDQDLVVAHPESGPFGPGIAAGAPDRRGVDPVADDPRPAADAARERLLDGGRHGEVHLGPARGEPVGEAGQPGVARPDVVLGDHYQWSPGGRQRTYRQSGTDGHERRMHVDEVEVVRADHSVQARDPPRIPGGGRAEAPDRVAAFGFQAGRERRLAGKEVGHGGLHEPSVAVLHLLHEELLRTPETESLDEVKNRQRRVK